MTKLSKNAISALFTLVFCLTLGFAALISEFFQAPILSSKELSKLQFLYSSSDFDKITKINLKSALGDFMLVKEASNSWMLTSPRNINANEEMINKILKTLEDIKIKKIYPSDQINMGNFSLDNPISVLTITNDKNESKVLSFGLINPIDNSTYLQVKGENVIYHINMLSLALERIELANFIDSLIFNYSLENTLDLKIYPFKSNFPSFNIEKKENEWQSSNTKLDTSSIGSFLDELKAIKTHIILDQIDETMVLEIEKIFQNMAHKIEVTDSNKNVVTYEISQPFNSLNNLKIEKRQNFLIRASNRKHLFVVNKDYLKVFGKRVSQLKENPIKKLIY